jgi:hypothetical protein
MLTLEEIASILGCSKPAASLLRAGKYDRPNSDLPKRYAALMDLVSRPQRLDREQVLTQLCVECDRQDCTGCRIAEIQ